MPRWWFLSLTLMLLVPAAPTRAAEKLIPIVMQLPGMR